MGALECVLSYQDSLKHVLWRSILDSSAIAPALLYLLHPCSRVSYGPGKTIHTPAQHQTTCIFQRLSVQTFAKSASLSGEESHLCYLPETIDPSIRAKPRGCSSLCRDLERHGCRARAYMDVLAACPGISYCMALASPMINGFQPVSSERRSS